MTSDNAKSRDTEPRPEDEEPGRGAVGDSSTGSAGDQPRPSYGETRTGTTHEAIPDRPDHEDSRGAAAGNLAHAKAPVFKRKGPLVLLAVLSMLDVAGVSVMTWADVPTTDPSMSLAQGAGAVALTGADLIPGLTQIALVGAAASVLVLFLDGVPRHLMGALVAAVGVALLVLIAPVLGGEHVGGIPPWGALVTAATGTLGGLGIIAFSGRWSTASSRYRAPAGKSGAQDARDSHDPAEDWDRLTRGEDPTL